jgi:hypothetical protein
LISKDRLPSQFGSEELQLYWELLRAKRVQTDQETVATQSTTASSSSGSVPTSFTSTQANSDSQSEEDTLKDDGTTVMLTNLPSEYTRVLLVETFEKEGFAGTYDFVFLPMDLRTRTGNGYALVNLRSNAEAKELMTHFAGFSSWGCDVSEDKVCETTWSRFIQGFDALIDRYRNSPVMNEAVPEIYKPAIYGASGQQEAFPEPTKRVRMPRLRRKSAKQRAEERDGAEVTVDSAEITETHVAGRSVSPAEDGGKARGIGRDVPLAKPTWKNKKPPVADSTPAVPVAQDAWFVDLVASRVARQAGPTAAAASRHGAVSAADTRRSPHPKACSVSPYNSPPVVPPSAPAWLGRTTPAMSTPMPCQIPRQKLISGDASLGVPMPVQWYWLMA